VGTTANGTVTTSCNGLPDCPVLFWPGSKQTIDGMYMSHPSIDTWWGGLITEKADPSGYKYMRNRYYNPQTGQFTQQDPIGLAGGLNLYGFADGDPVSNEDFPGRHQVYQENWYDALGRRVLVRARKSAACNAGTHGEVACKSFIERTSWDGDQILIEKRSNGAQGLSSNALDQGSGSSDAWGTVVSVHAHGIDPRDLLNQITGYPSASIVELNKARLPGHHTEGFKASSSQDLPNTCILKQTQE
jgi:RHS repeat-associated protein